MRWYLNSMQIVSMDYLQTNMAERCRMYDV